MTHVSKRKILAVLSVFALGTVAGAWAAKIRITSDYYRDKTPEDAGISLLTAARSIAEADGSWEKIAVAQIYYLSDREAEAEALFHSIRKKDASDWIRIGRVYYRAGDWDKAREAFERVISDAPEDEDWLAEIGMYHNLQGDRETAEALFDRSFEEGPKNLYNILKAAGSYLGVEER